MDKINMMYDLKVVGTIYEDQQELEVEFMPADDEKQAFNDDLHSLMDKYDCGILIS